MKERGSTHLDGDVCSSTVDTEGLITAPRDADMVEDHVLALCDASCILASRASLAHANADVSYDGVVGIRERPAVAVNSNAFSWCGLSEDADALGDYNALLDLN